MRRAGCIDFMNYHAQWQLTQARCGKPIDFFSSEFQPGTEEQRCYRERKFREHFLKCRQCRRNVRTRPIYNSKSRSGLD